MCTLQSELRRIFFFGGGGVRKLETIFFSHVRVGGGVIKLLTNEVITITDTSIDHVDI